LPVGIKEIELTTVLSKVRSRVFGDVLSVGYSSR
jgi:hypothetical protein